MANTNIEIGWRSNSLPKNDFKFCEETLMLDEKGYFLKGEGGAMSKFANYNANRQESSYGKGTIRISNAEAVKWAYEYGFAAELKASGSDKTLKLCKEYEDDNYTFSLKYDV